MSLASGRGEAKIMRKALLALLALGAISVGCPGSAAAHEYRYCLQSTVEGTYCLFTSYDQCMLAASGRGAECIVNPTIAFAEQAQPPQPQPPRRARHVHHTSDY
jgi:hypothetical protein